DALRPTMTWEGHAEKIRAPYLCVAGEFDELSPLVHTERLIQALQGPKRLVVYQDSRHSVGNVPATNLGPFPPILMADWLAAKPRLESLVLLSAIAARTRRVRLGTCCLSTFPLRDPIFLAAQWAALDQVSHGRTILGACIGGSLPREKAEAEFAAFKVKLSER